MTISIPVLDGPEQVALTLHCWTDDDQPNSQSSLTDTVEKHAKIVGRDIPQWLYLWMSHASFEEKRICHFALEVTKEPWFTQRSHDKDAATTETEIQGILEQFINRSGGVYLRGRYNLAPDKMPRQGSIAALLGISTVSSGTTLTLTGGRLSMKGDQFRELSWQVEDDGRLTVTIEATTATKFEATTFDRMKELADTGFRRFVLGAETEKTTGSME